MVYEAGRQPTGLTGPTGPTARALPTRATRRRRAGIWCTPRAGRVRLISRPAGGAAVLNTGQAGGLGRCKVHQWTVRRDSAAARPDRRTPAALRRATGSGINKPAAGRRPERPARSSRGRNEAIDLRAAPTRPLGRCSTPSVMQCLLEAAPSTHEWSRHATLSTLAALGTLAALAAVGMPPLPGVSSARSAAGSPAARAAEPQRPLMSHPRCPVPAGRTASLPCRHAVSAADSTNEIMCSARSASPPSGLRTPHQDK